MSSGKLDWYETGSSEDGWDGDEIWAVLKWVIQKKGAGGFEAMRDWYLR